MYGIHGELRKDKAKDTATDSMCGGISRQPCRSGTYFHVEPCRHFFGSTFRVTIMNATRKTCMPSIGANACDLRSATIEAFVSKPSL